MNSNIENRSLGQRETSPGTPAQAMDEMDNEAETLKDLKKKRASAKAKFTIRKDAILSSLQNPDIPESRVTDEINGSRLQYVYWTATLTELITIRRNYSDYDHED